MYNILKISILLFFTLNSVSTFFDRLFDYPYINEDNNITNVHINIPTNVHININDFNKTIYCEHYDTGRYWYSYNRLGKIKKRMIYKNESNSKYEFGYIYPTEYNDYCDIRPSISCRLHYLTIKNISYFDANKYYIIPNNTLYTRRLCETTLIIYDNSSDCIRKDNEITCTILMSNNTSPFFDVFYIDKLNNKHIEKSELNKYMNLIYNYTFSINTLDVLKKEKRIYYIPLWTNFIIEKHIEIYPKEEKINNVFNIFEFLRKWVLFLNK